jgi:hypothetical protein
MGQFGVREMGHSRGYAVTSDGVMPRAGFPFGSPAATVMAFGPPHSAVAQSQKLFSLFVECERGVMQKCGSLSGHRRPVNRHWLPSGGTFRLVHPPRWSCQ